MSAAATSIVQKVWNYAHVLRDDGLGFLEYTEQITYLLFLKLASEQSVEDPEYQIPKRYLWDSLRSTIDNRKLKQRYEQALKNLSKKPGLLGLIFTKPQTKIEDPAKLRHLINMIEEEDWTSFDIDVKGEIYESLLARNSEDVRGGAGQYFTPRPVIRAVVEVMRPTPGMTIFDPACGTGGFLLAAHEHLRKLKMNKTQERFLRTKALGGTDIVPNVARLCMMNLYLHGIGVDPQMPPINVGDSLAREPRRKFDMVLTNPPFGKKSSITVVSAGGKIDYDDISYARDDFWATTRNKQLNFVQHVYSLLKEGGTAAMVVPDNVLFEGGAGEKIRRELLTRADVHTVLRLPTGIWYSPGVKANLLFFDRSRSSMQEIWIYDLRTNKNFTLRQNPLTPGDLTDFVKCYCSDDRAKRKESDRFRRYARADILASEKASLDLFSLRDDSYQHPDNLPSHDVIAVEIVSLLKEAVSEFEEVITLINRRPKM